MSDSLDFNAWRGRTEEVTGTVDPDRAAMLAALLDRPVAPAAGDVLPPLWHWLMGPPRARQSKLGEDGHPRKGGFLPPVPLPRRMWAGSRVVLGPALTVGEPMRRVSTITDIETRTGRSGPLIFVHVRHETAGAGGGMVVEDQDVVYRDAGRGAEAGAIEVDGGAADHRRRITTDPVLLFRFSAVTFNAHRIHYDRPYATGVEGYPGLVVHGPLTALLLMEMLTGHVAQPVRDFAFRAVAPLFDGLPIDLALRRGADGDIALSASDASGRLGMTATATLGGVDNARSAPETPSADDTRHPRGAT